MRYKSPLKSVMKVPCKIYPLKCATPAASSGSNPKIFKLQKAQPLVSILTTASQEIQVNGLLSNESRGNAKFHI